MWRSLLFERVVEEFLFTCIFRDGLHSDETCGSGAAECIQIFEALRFRGRLDIRVPAGVSADPSNSSDRPHRSGSRCIQFAEGLESD